VVTGVLIPLVTRRLVDDAIVGGQRHLVWPLGVAVLGLGLLQAGSIFFRRNLGHATSTAIETDLRARLFRQFQALPLSFHRRHGTGQLLARATGDLQAVSGFFGNSLVFLIHFTLTFIAVAVVLVLLDPLLAVLTLGFVVPALLSARLYHRRMAGVAARARQAAGEVTTVLDDNIGGLMVLRGFGQEHQAQSRLERAASALRSVNLEAVSRQSLYVPALGLVPALVTAAILGVGGRQAIDGRLSVGELVAFSQYLALVLNPLRVAGWHLSGIPRALAAGERVLEVLDQPPLEDRPDARPLEEPAGEVVFDRVTFSYDGAASSAVADVSLTIRPGETVALVGPSGAGCSTLAALVPRLADPTSGRVLLDGVDTRATTVASLRRHVGVAFDDPVLFKGSVRDNIAFANPDAGEDRVREAAAAAGIDQFVADLPDGYDTPVGERGSALSGGQRQRVALARALLTRPRVLVLDDPLSSVDVETEAEVCRRLRTLLPEHTTLLVARRPSTLALADRVVLMGEGRVVASGTHEELLACPAYRAHFDLDRAPGAAEMRP